jgi:hypothetical protein
LLFVLALSPFGGPFQAWADSMAWPLGLHRHEVFELGVVNGASVKVNHFSTQLQPSSLWPKTLPQFIRQNHQTWPVQWETSETPFSSALEKLWPAHQVPKTFWTQIPQERRWLLIVLFVVLALSIYAYPSKKIVKLFLSLGLLLVLIFIPPYHRSVSWSDGEHVWLLSTQKTPETVASYQWAEEPSFYISRTPAAQNTPLESFWAESIPCTILKLKENSLNRLLSE